MTRHMTVRYAEPDSGEPWDWTCYRHPRPHIGHAATADDAVYAASVHALDEHGHGNEAVELYDQTGARQCRYGWCGDRTCTDCYPIPETAHISPDRCMRCGGYGCDECRNCHCPKCRGRVAGYVADSVARWRPAS